MRFVPLLVGVLSVSPARAQRAVPTPRLTLGDVVETTLARSSDIALTELSVRAQTGVLLQTSAAFEPQMRASVSGDHASTPTFGGESAPPGSVLAANVRYAAAADWLLRPGLTISPSLSYLRADVPGGAGLARNTGVAGLGVTVPLLRGRGGGFAWAAERAANAVVDASVADLGHVRARAVFEAVSAYWGYVVAIQARTALQESEGRARRLMEQTRTLIEADERPAVDSISVAANLAAKRANRLAGEDAVATARQALAEAMGLPADDVATLPPPADSFPGAPDAAEVAAWPSDSIWLAQALQRRADLAAARSRSAAARTLLRGARNDVLSRLDLTAEVAYTGIQQGGGFNRLFPQFGSSQRGFATLVGFSYALPIGNSAAEGQFVRHAASERQSEVAVQELMRRISLAVVTSAEVLRRTAEALRLSEQAAHLYASSVDNENQRFRLGTATTFDVIIAEDALTGARLSWINTQRRYAVAVVQLRFHTGALLLDAQCVASAREQLTSARSVCPP